MGHIVSTVEFANYITKNHPEISTTILIITMPHTSLVNTYTQSRASTDTNLRFIYLPTVDPPTPDQYQSLNGFLSLLIQNHKNNIKNALLDIMITESTSESVKLAALFIDLFSTTIIDVAEELSVPCYLLFASPASFLGFMLHLPQVESIESDTEFEIPSFKNKLPRLVLPNLALNWKTEDGYSWFSYHGRRYRETKGIIVNTLQELEPHALQSLHNDLQLPPVYSIGPIVDHVGPVQWDPNPAQYDYIMKWLDMQPLASVVFLCFGSMGSLEAKQVEQIAIGLERVGVRFLWALREPPKTRLEGPRNYTSHEDVLPVGFLKRTAEMGIVCGWVPQVKVLAHKAVGGFVSHCGWNSILESLWYGVPIATWPIYAEQQMNAFQMVKELGLAVEIRMDYRRGGDLVVQAEEVENGISTLMNGSDEIRRKVKDMSEKCRVALMENGSSYTNLLSFIHQLTK
nr:UDP-glycosyltransferase [Cicer arietinum]